MTDDFRPPDDPKLHEAIAALRPDLREAAAQLAARAVADDPFYRTDSGRRLAWEFGIARAREHRRECDEASKTSEASKEPARIEVLSAAGLLDLSIPDTVWRIGSVLPDTSLTILSGWSGTWKTWLLHHAAYALATGGRFLDAYQCQQGRVLLIQAEESLFEHRRKFTWTVGGADEPNPRDLDIHSRVGPLLLSERGEMAELICLVRDLKPNVVLIDSVRQTFAGDENASSFAQVVKLAYSEIQAAHPCAVVLVHHTRKVAREAALNEPGQRLRGTGAMRAVLDQHWSVERDPAGFGKFVHEKSRQGVEARAINFRFHGAEGRARFENMGPAEDPGAGSGAPRAVLDLLSDQPDGTLTRRQLVLQLSPDFSKDQVGRALTRLSRSKRVRKGERNGSGTPFTLIEGGQYKGNAFEGDDNEG